MDSFLVETKVPLYSCIQKHTLSHTLTIPQTPPPNTHALPECSSVCPATQRCCCCSHRIPVTGFCLAVSSALCHVAKLSWVPNFIMSSSPPPTHTRTHNTTATPPIPTLPQFNHMALSRCNSLNACFHSTLVKSQSRREKQCPCVNSK